MAKQTYDSKLEQAGLVRHATNRGSLRLAKIADEQKEYILERRSPKDYEGVLIDIRFSPKHESAAQGSRLLALKGMGLDFWYKNDGLMWNVDAVRNVLKKKSIPEKGFINERVQTYSVYTYPHNQAILDGLVSDPAAVQYAFKFLESLRKIGPDNRAFLRKLLV